ncbi:hypothetical protein EVAR_90755_1 [Eumeta japonica]|uniref:Uncharacterized protein n=1 Tax=Eumeta variegata TaxID=151549 RepID=A0A4C1ZCQ1_EUMVA|nr:hypothetical protein EVAR_90755_1 [Eumeta japonica]
MRDKEQVKSSVTSNPKYENEKGICLLFCPIFEVGQRNVTMRDKEQVKISVTSNPKYENEKEDVPTVTRITDDNVDGVAVKMAAGLCVDMRVSEPGSTEVK